MLHATRIRVFYKYVRSISKWQFLKIVERESSVRCLNAQQIKL